MSASGSGRNQVNLESIAKGGSVEAGSLLFDRGGQIVQRQDGRPLRFCFEYRDAPYEVEVQLGSDSRLRLTGLFGGLPYTAECPAVRPLILKLIESSKGFKRGQLSVSAERQIELQAQAPLSDTPTPASIMAAVITLLLEFKPCVELLKDMLASKAPMPPMEIEDPTQRLKAAASLGSSRP